MNFKKYCHEHMIAVIATNYPGLVHGKDFLVAQPVGVDGGLTDKPFIAAWYAEEIRPTDDELHAMFDADEEAYRAAHIRSYRDEALRVTDGKANAPTDAPPSVAAQSEAWRTYRQALRDLPAQPGFPNTVTWPEIPQ
ncbi:XkdW family protein [Paraburkholderia oxyphila]|uniref:XkdW family protein n=1 Tax=Paraburkholderia oxyphila TaxID=614212 RepID=UPI000485F069|nr:phage tail assembly chaperone [Paraburkholderia oxyphila]